MRKWFPLKRYRETINAILNVSIVIIFVLLLTFKVALSFQNSVETEDLREKINSAFQRAGILEGHVQYNEKLKMFEVMGKFRTHEEFLYAYMIAQTYAGVTKVSPVYSIKHAVIIHTPIERCLPYVILGRECPHIKRKEKDRSEVNEQISSELKDKKKIALILGISTFADKRISSIVGADNDALLWGHYLVNLGYKVFYLINENATRKKVLDMVDTIVENLKDGDVFVFIASSHGAPKNEKGEVGIVLHDSGELSQHKCIDFVPAEPHLQAANKMCALVKDSLSIERDILQKLSGKNVTFIPILDACYSGDALRGYLGDVIKAEEVAPLDFYESRLRRVAPKALGMLVASSNGFRLSYSTGDVRKIDIVNEKMIAVTDRGIKQLEKSLMGESSSFSNIVFRPFSHGIFSFIYVNSLPNNENRLVKALETTRDNINRISKRVCEAESSGKGIRVVRKCPEDGQQPVVLKINLEEFVF